MRSLVLPLFVVGCAGAASRSSPATPTIADESTCAVARSEIVPSADWPAPFPAAVEPSRALFLERRDAEASIEAAALLGGAPSAEERVAATIVLSRAYHAMGLDFSAVSVTVELAQAAADEPALGAAEPFLEAQTLLLADSPHTAEAAMLALGLWAGGEPPRHPAHLLLLARARHDEGDFAGAAALLSSIPAEAPEAPEASWVRAEVALRTTDLELAARLFAELARVEPCDERRDLAALSLARVVLEHADGDYEHPGTELVHAYHLFEAVDPRGEWAEDAAFGRASIARILREPAIGREALRSIGAAYRLAYPEVELLDGLLAAEACQFAEARTSIDRVRAGVASVDAAIAAMIDGTDDETFVARVRAFLASPLHETPVDGALRLLFTRDLHGARATLASLVALEREADRLAALPMSWRQTAAGTRATQDAFLARGFVVDQLGGAIRGRIDRLSDDWGRVHVETLATELEHWSCDESVSAAASAGARRGSSAVWR